MKNKENLKQQSWKKEIKKERKKVVKWGESIVRNSEKRERT